MVAVETLPFLLHFQHSEEMYDPEIYRHQISEYYNPYVLDAEIQAGELNSSLAGFEPAPYFPHGYCNCETPLSVNTTYSTHWHGSYSSSTNVKYFQFSVIAHVRQHIFSVSDFFLLMYCGQHKTRVQLEHTTSGCREHRKQMPFLSTGADTESLSPHGVLLTLLSLSINSFEYCTEILQDFERGGGATWKKSHRRMQRSV